MDLVKVKRTILGLVLLPCVIDLWTSAADPACSYETKIQLYYDYALIGYSWRGAQSTNCQWRIFSDTRVRFTCKNRRQDCSIKLVVSEGKRLQPVTYCAGSFIHETLGDNILVELHGPPYIPDGYLNCEFRAADCMCGWKKSDPYDYENSNAIDNNLLDDVSDYNFKLLNEAANTSKIAEEPETSNDIVDNSIPVDIRKSNDELTNQGSEGVKISNDIRPVKKIPLGLRKLNVTLTNKPRIVGGVPTLVNEYPMMAGLIDVHKKTLFCGATIISPRYVVTAAHCLQEKSPEMLGVLTGDYDLSTNSDTVANDLFPVDYFNIHPNYVKSKNYYDIGIIKVAGYIEVTWEVGPACLPFQNRRYDFNNEWVTLLGWGTTSFGGNLSKTLQKVTVQVTNFYLCQREYPHLRENQICTFSEGKDACQFDSGGPVLWQDPVTGKIVLIGIISYGEGCGGTKPSINTRITETLDWIQQMAPEVFFCKID